MSRKNQRYSKEFKAEAVRTVVSVQPEPSGQNLTN
ncbi:transposase family [Shigella dysenteriae]|uniref:Transposase family n=1 Tax=Shigella dysenteriae TaxID=622 RepID=A0A3P6KX27_SHIDY|nr:transposase family [Shigella dysenteriae]